MCSVSTDAKQQKHLAANSVEVNTYAWGGTLEQDNLTEDFFSRSSLHFHKNFKPDVFVDPYPVSVNKPSSIKSEVSAWFPPSKTNRTNIPPLHVFNKVPSLAAVPEL